MLHQLIVVCHGVPSNKILRDGDIVNVDVTALKMVSMVMYKQNL